MNKASLKRLFLIGVVSSLVVSAIVGIFVLLRGNFDSTDWKVLGTTFAVGVFSITSLANLRTLDSGNSLIRSFSAVSIIISIAALCLVAGLLWAESTSDIIGKFTATFSVLAVSSAHASLLLPLRAHSARQKVIVTATLMFIAAVATMIIYLILASDTEVGDMYYRILGVFAILDVLGTIISPIMARFASK